MPKRIIEKIFKIGDHVVPKYYNGPYYDRVQDKIGVVVHLPGWSPWPNCYVVDIPGVISKADDNGYWFFTSDQLEISNSA